MRCSDESSEQRDGVDPHKYELRPKGERAKEGEVKCHAVDEGRDNSGRADALRGGLIAKLDKFLVLTAITDDTRNKLRGIILIRDSS